MIGGRPPGGSRWSPLFSPPSFGSGRRVKRPRCTFRTWATPQGLAPSETAYVARDCKRQPLRFCISGRERVAGLLHALGVASAVGAETAAAHRAAEPAADQGCHRAAQRVDLLAVRCGVLTASMLRSGGPI